MQRSLPSAARAGAAVVVFAILAAAPLIAQNAPIRGFPASMLSSERQLEATAHAVPSPDSLRDRMRLLSEEPHEAGSDRSKHVAELILARFKAMGLDAHIEQFEAYMPVPVSRSLKLVQPGGFVATLVEPPLAQDKDSDDPHQLPTFNAYSADGDVEGDLVYVNYGVPEDYAVLDSLGISVKGKIVIARYGRSWRGIKPKVAAEHGAIGCIIYSDPANDGYVQGDVYPDSTMRPWFGVQRGSVMDMPVYPGDPLTPGWASEPGGRKLPLDQVRTIMKIPVLPISYQDALPFLKNLDGPTAPASWRGGLPITYHIGPGVSRAHLALKFEWKNRPLYDVIVRIPGALSPDRWVVYGNHHDAWVNGAEDPLSGTVSLEETARSLATLLKQGWRPARTIILAAWDGEEWGLLGSTEWMEKHQDELRDKGVAYLGSDTNYRGWLGADGSHSLEVFIEQVARDIPDPDTKNSVLQAWLDHRRERAPQNLEDSVAFHIGALGSGSDYTAFLDHVGMASANLSYGGSTGAGVYHSIYDSFDFYRRFLDPTYQYEVTESRTMTSALMRLADAPVLPLEFTRAAKTYREYADQIAGEAKKKDATKDLDLSAVYTALDHLDRAAARFETAMAAIDGLDARTVRARWTDLQKVNTPLAHAEEALTSDQGLPDRDWFRHLIYAPGFYTGYGVKTMAGVREAVEDVPDGQVAQAQAARVARALERYAARVDEAAGALERIR